MIHEHDDDGSCGAGEGPAGLRASEDALRDALRIEIRQDQIVITIHRDALEAVAATAALSARRDVHAVLPRAAASTAAHAARGMSREPPAPFVGLTTAPADKVRDGFSSVQMRADLVESYRSALLHVHALGGALTSSGALRDLREPATAGRSKTSLHYTGRAIDLFIYSGMQHADDQYLVTRSGGEDANPEWTIYCVSTAPTFASPLYDASLIAERDVECVRWVQGKGYATFTRRATCFSLTDVMARYGWEPIPARSTWKTVYESCEWWHFQNAQGMTPGVTTFGDQLMQVWPAEAVRASGLTLDAVWAGRSFRGGTAIAPVQPNGASVDAAEKVLWAQTVLNAVAGAALGADGKLGPRTTAAIQGFQSSNGIAATAILDATTEVALLQRVLERLDSATFPRIGVLDDATVGAIADFQRAQGLKPDGQAGPKTRAAIIAALTGGTLRSAPRERASPRRDGANGGTPRKRRGAKRIHRASGKR